MIYPVHDGFTIMTEHQPWSQETDIVSLNVRITVNTIYLIIGKTVKIVKISTAPLFHCIFKNLLNSVIRNYGLYFTGDCFVTRVLYSDHSSRTCVSGRAVPVHSEIAYNGRDAGTGFIAGALPGCAMGNTAGKSFKHLICLQGASV